MPRIYYKEEKIAGQSFSNRVINIEAFNEIFECMDARLFKFDQPTQAGFFKSYLDIRKSFSNMHNCPEMAFRITRLKVVFIYQQPLFSMMWMMLIFQVNFILLPKLDSN